MIKRFKTNKATMYCLLFLVMAFRSFIVFSNPQTRTINGVIKDAKEVTLPGVSIVVKGTSIGTTSDANGLYSINVPNNQAALVFTFIGFVTQEVSVGNKTVVDITLDEDSQLLDEVVVVGYGVLRKSDVTGSIAVVGSEKLLETPSFSALQGMKGRAAGVNIFSNTGNPLGVGDKGPRVVIRGANSISTSTDPLYVVDGVQMNEIQFLNPNDIERMEILKDASATAIFGARGANGVILVSTKRGSGAGEGTTVSYAGWMTVSTLAKKVEVMNSAEFMKVMDISFENLKYYPDGRNWLKENGLTEAKVDRSDTRFFDSNGNPLYDTDWQDAATRVAFSHSHQLNIQSQAGKSSVGAFLNYTDQQGIIINNYSKRLSVKMTYDSKIKDWVTMSTNFLVNHLWGNGVDDDGGGQVARRTMLEMPPIIPVKMPDGSWTDSSTPATNMSFEGMANPVAEMEMVRRNRYRTKLFGNLGFTFHLLDGLDLRSQVGVDGNIRMDKNFTPVLRNMSNTGDASIYNGQNLLWQQENFLMYNKVLNGIHRINGTLGLSWTQYTEHSSNTGTVSNFTSDRFGYDNLGVGTKPSAPSSDWSRWSMNSYFGRLAYTLMDKYMFTGTFRIDGSSRFGVNNKYGVFPSMGLGWLVSNEGFMKNLTWINNLKLHTSTGATGNSEIDSYSTLATMSSGTYLINGERAPYSVMSRMPNPDLRWEKTNQFDAGINLGLFANRIILELDYYYKKTTDLLLGRPLPQTTGFSSVMDNIGRVDNQGIDFMLTVYPIRNTTFMWESVVNLNYNKNEVKKLGANNEDITDAGINWVSAQNILRVGKPMSSFYGYERYGTYSESEANADPANILAGTAKRSDEKKIIGKGMPSLTGSFINRFTYDKFDLLVDLQFVTGVDVWQLTFHSLEDRTGGSNGLKTILYDSWTPTNQNTMVQRIRNQPKAGQDSRADSRWVADGSYLRGNLIQLGYTVDTKQLEKWKIKALRVNIGIQNAFLLHSKDFKGYDPEGSTSTNRFQQNMMFYQYPSARSFTMGLNLSF